MTKKPPLNQFLETLEGRRAYEEERLVLDTAFALESARRQLGITRKELAERLGVTMGAVSQVLGGDSNLTLRRLARILFALEKRANIKLAVLNEEECANREREAETKVNSWSNVIPIPDLIRQGTDCEDASEWVREEYLETGEAQAV